MKFWIGLRVRLFKIFLEKKYTFCVNKSLLLFLCVCLGFLEKSFYQKKSILTLK